MDSGARRHLCAVLTGPAAPAVEALRRRWDPVMASLTPAHLTVVYPEEAGDEALLLRRAARAARETPPFRIRLGEVFGEDDGRGGVFLAVADTDGGWAGLRRAMLAPPFRPVSFPPHVTVAHPRTSRHGERCLAELSGHRVDGGFRVAEVWFTETSATRFTVLRRFPLRVQRPPYR